MYQIYTKEELKSRELLDLIEIIATKAIEEGSGGTFIDKYDSQTPGETLVIVYDGRPAGIAHLEPSWYTGDEDIAVRACRYHILKEFRNKQLGFILLPELMRIAKDMGFKVMWWSLEPSQVALNNAYQGKRRTIQKEKIWNNTYDEDFWSKIIYDQRYMFMVDSDAPHYLQNVYWIDLTEEGYDWNPIKNMVLK
mgnify:CR=1 FL=1|tara:strand:+ start:925 stop:1506 length:582 start_codon:yes stop_codon:yes gene_type:complete